MIKDQYVLLTGARNNAGDHLIKDRAIDLLSALRPDRRLIDRNGWQDFSRDDLKLINESRALILTGGPAINPQMVPNTYSLESILDEINVPVILLGLGAASPGGEWATTRNYKFNKASERLLAKVSRSGHISSVRDFQALNVLLSSGIDNVMMTGCPAWYSLDHIGTHVKVPEKIRKIGFSAGVKFAQSKRMLDAAQCCLLQLRKEFPKTEIEVAFHHSTNIDELNREYKNSPLASGQTALLEWLRENDFLYCDVSGNAEGMKSFYETCDLHIGYRVHAHIYMCSISRPSVLISEDGRGVAQNQALGGIALQGMDTFRNRSIDKAIARCVRIDRYEVDGPGLAQELCQNIRNDLTQGAHRLKQPRSTIDSYLRQMKYFIDQLP